MNSSRVSAAGSGGALTSIPSMLINHRFSLTHWWTICSCTLRPRGSPARGRTARSSSRNSLHTLTTFIRSVSHVSTRNSYLIVGSSLAGLAASSLRNSACLNLRDIWQASSPLLISRLPSIASRLTCAAHRSIYTFTRAVPLFLPVSSVRTSERQGGQDAKSCPRNSRGVSFDFTGTHLQRCRPRHRILQISLWRHGNHAHARPRRQDHARRGQNRRLHHFHKR